MNSQPFRSFHCISWEEKKETCLLVGVRNLVKGKAAMGNSTGMNPGVWSASYGQY
jgi:hypothetical protein